MVSLHEVEDGYGSISSSDQSFDNVPSQKATTSDDEIGFFWRAHYIKYNSENIEREVGETECRNSSFFGCRIDGSFDGYLPL